MSDTPTTTYTPERCRELVEHFRGQVLDFIRKLDGFPDWEGSALEADPERHFYACLAGCLWEELVGVGPGFEESLSDAIRALEAGEIDPGGVLGQLNRPEVEDQRERVLSLGYTLFHIRESEIGGNHAA